MGYYTALWAVATVPFGAVLQGRIDIRTRSTCSRPNYKIRIKFIRRVNLITPTNLANIVYA